MKNIVLFFVFVSFLSCKENPTYNPFDKQTNISINSIKSGRCKLIPVQCGYFNWVNQVNNNLNIYYQFYIDDPNKIIAKGFYYSVDSIKVNIYNYKRRQIKDFILALPFDIEKLNKNLIPYNYEYLTTSKKYDNLLKMYKWEILIINKTRKDTIPLFFDVFPNENGFAYREIAYFNSFEDK